jgi:hypothetical protein
MFRKLALGLVAAASLGAAAIAPTAASAWDGGPHHRGYDNYRPYHGFGMNRGWHRSHAYFGPRGCIQQRLVPTPYGPRYRTVNVCR